MNLGCPVGLLEAAAHVWQERGGDGLYVIDDEQVSE
jgi:hypothetical protein